MARIKLLPLDPGMNDTGWSSIMFNPKDGSMTVSEAGTLKSVNQAKRVHNSERREAFSTRIVTLDVLRQQIGELFDRLQPDYVISEDIFISPNPLMFSAYVALSQWMTIVQMTMYDRGMPVYRIPTRQAKQTVANHGGADKDNMQDAIFSLENLSFKKRIKTLNEHETDAVAVGYAFGRGTLPELLNKE